MVHLLKDTLEQRKEEYLQYLCDLVACDTQDLGHGIAGGREKAGQEYMEVLFEKIGADEIVKDPMTEAAIKACFDTYGEGNLGHNYEDRYNLYALFKGDNTSKTLIFNGHIDTMPPGDESAWIYPPHTPTVADGKIYGLGTADMKSGLIASVLAVKLLKDSSEKHIIEIAYESGFNSKTSFYRAFNKNYNVNPTEYKLKLDQKK